MKIKNALEIFPKINKNTKKILLSNILNTLPSQLILKYEENLTKIEEKKYIKYIKQARTTPVQYIIKKAYFLNNEFLVNENVLIPRPETENLVIQTNELIKKHITAKNIKILDIGTGSGVIAISLKKLNNNYNISASDISKKALKIANINAKNNNTNINFIHSNIFKNIKENYDVIISNPPYIDKKEKIETMVYKKEPHKALFAKHEGLYYYEKIIKESIKVLNTPNILAFEIGAYQAQKIKNIAQIYHKNAQIVIKKDLNDYERYIFIINE